VSAEEQFRVLVVDDEARVRMACRRVLEGEGLTVFEAEDGQKGLEALDQASPDLVLVDLMMPNIGGMELMAAAREKHPDLAFVVITGYATLEKAVEAMKQGADDFLAKPFKPKDLRQVVKRVLRRARTLLDMEIEKSRTRLVLDSTSNGVLVLNADGKVALMNPALRAMIGWDQSDSPRGMQVAKVMPCPEVVETLLRILEPGADEFSEKVPCQIKSAQIGESLHVQAYCRPFKDSQGNLIGAVAICNDVTAWHHLDDLKNEYVSTVAHDIASPLGSVISQLQTLQKGLCGELNEKQSQMIGRAILRVQGIVDMSKDLLSLARLDEGAEVNLEEVDLIPLIQDSYEVHEAKAAKRGQTLELDVPDSLPAMLGVGRALKQVIDNLVGNALRYTPEGGRIILRARPRDNELLIEVIDNGFGIPEEDQGRIFQRFYRVKDANTRHIVGTGLGLPIVKKVVEDHGGRLELESQPGEGSTFRVYLPLKPGA
jgi:two-component system phosphate regulon sensor histidine kinase PhoR